MSPHVLLNLYRILHECSCIIDLYGGSYPSAHALLNLYRFHECSCIISSACRQFTRNIRTIQLIFYLS